MIKPRGVTLTAWRANQEGWARWLAEVSAERPRVARAAESVAALTEAAMSIRPGRQVRHVVEDVLAQVQSEIRNLTRAELTEALKALEQYWHYGVSFYTYASRKDFVPRRQRS